MRRKEHHCSNNESDDEEEVCSVENENNLDKQKSDFDELKSLLVNTSNMEIMKAKLLSTMQYRAALLNNKEMDLKKEFPFFFVSAELVSS